MKRILFAAILVVIFSFGILVGIQVRGETQAAPEPSLWADLCVYKVDYIPEFYGVRNFYVLTTIVTNYDGRWFPDSYAVNAARSLDCQRGYW